jgi:hypothetical protein
VFNYVGTRSYGLYLYHWPIYQIIRSQAGVPMSKMQWLLAMVLTVPITELSYQLIETPIRQGHLGQWLRGERRPRTARAYKKRQRMAGFGVAGAALIGFAGVSIAMADNQCVGVVDCSRASAALPVVPPPIETAAPVNLPVSAVATNVAPAAVAETVPTQPPTSTAPPTTVLIDKPYIAFGESVMLGAKATLDARGITTVAEVSAGPAWMLDQIKAAKSRYRFTGAAVIQLGTNGTVTQADFDAVLNEFSNLNLIVVLTVKAPKPWIEGNNAIIRALPGTHPNVKVVDWEQQALDPTLGIEAHLSASDGRIHLSDKTAIDFYTNLILGGLGLVS